MTRGPAPTWFPIRRQILDSSIWEESPVTCKLWVTLLILGSEPGRRGVVDMTVRALAARACMSEEETLTALAVLLAPDVQSRSRVADGRRLLPLDPDREWGWVIVNFEAFEKTLSAAGSTMRSRGRRLNAAKRNAAQRNASEPTKEKEKEKENEKEKEKGNEKERENESYAEPPRPAIGRAAGENDGFEEFWLVYPRRAKKPNARRAWSALSGRDREAALGGAKVYAEVFQRPGADLKHAQHPATWLRARSWEDGPEEWARVVDRDVKPANPGALVGAHATAETAKRQAARVEPPWVRAIIDAQAHSARPDVPDDLWDAVIEWERGERSDEAEPKEWRERLEAAIAAAAALEQRWGNERKAAAVA